MKSIPLSEYPAPIPSLALRLEVLERQLGQPQAPGDLDENVVRIAHELRTHLTLHYLSSYLAARSCSAN